MLNYPPNNKTGVGPVFCETLKLVGEAGFEAVTAAARDLSRMTVVGMAETVLKQHGVSTRSMSATAS